MEYKAVGFKSNKRNILQWQQQIVRGTHKQKVKQRNQRIWPVKKGNNT